MPLNLKPMLAELSGNVFSDDRWIFEIKWDGYRAVAEVKDGKVNLHSRNNISFNEKYFSIVETLKLFDMDIILDGEVVVVDDFGKASFQLLQTYGKSGKGKLAYYVFDILYLDGYDLTNLSLIKRKEILKKIIPGDLVNIKYSDHIVRDGESFFKVAEQRGLEGILAKRADSKYLPGKRSKDWLKLKTKKRQEAIICGFTEPKGSRNKFGSLVLGVYDEGDLVYIGQAGTGFTDNDLKDIYSLLKPLITDNPSFKKKIVSIWGNTVPEFGMYPYHPHSESAIFEIKGLKCRPCSKIGFKECPKKHFKCINDMNEDVIAKKMVELYNR